MATIDDRIQYRHDFMDKLYELVNGSLRESVDYKSVGVQAGLPTEQEIETTYQYLSNGGYVKLLSMQGTIQITALGIDYVESRAQDREATLSVFLAPEEHAELEALVRDIQQDVESNKLQITSQEDQLELESVLEALPVLNRAPRTRRAIVKECLKSVRTIIEGTAASALVAYYIQKYGGLPW